MFFFISCNDSSSTNKVTQKVVANEGGKIELPDGSSLVIPKNALSNDTKISITIDENNSSYIFEPDGLTSGVPMIFKVPTNKILKKGTTKIVNYYILSKESPLVDFRTEQVKVEKLVSEMSGNFERDSTIDMSINHFSQIIRVIQEPLYISYFLPSKYLEKGDILTYLSPENYLNNTEGYDWFPGHNSLIINPNGEDCIINGENDKCDMIESTPPKVRLYKNYEDSYMNNHIYMGARRSKEYTLSSQEKEDLVNFAKKQIDKDWTFVNSNEWFSSKYITFSCVGLIEASYESINKGLLFDFSIGVLGNPPMPLDLYEVTKPVNEITEIIGNTIKFRINPIYSVFKPAGGTSQIYGYNYYNDYRDINTASSDFKFNATNLPEGSTFDSNTGMFTWNDIPSKYAGKEVNITFKLSNSYYTILGGKEYATVLETLKINIIEDNSINSLPSLSGGVNIIDITNGFRVNSQTAMGIVDKYEFYRSTSSRNIGRLIHSSIFNIFEDTGLTNGVTYYYTIKACNSAGCSSSNQNYKKYEISTNQAQDYEINIHNSWNNPLNRTLITNTNYDYDSDVYFDNHGFRHGAVDIKANYNENVYSIDNGKIVTFRKDIANNNKNMSIIYVEHETDENQKFLGIYGHVYITDNLNIGDTVKKGQLIGNIKEEE